MSEYLGKLFLRTLESKEDAIKTLMTAISRNFKVSEGLNGTLDRFEENNTPEHRERQLKTCIKFLHHMNKCVRISSNYCINQKRKIL